MRLTDAAAKRLRPTDKRREVADDLCPGLYLVIQPSGKKSWAFRYRHQGRPRKWTLGNLEALPPAKARDMARKAKEVVRAGRDPAAHQDEAALTLRGAFDLYAQRRLSQLKTGRELRRQLERDVMPELGDKPLNDLERRDVHELVHAIAARAPVSANRVLAATQSLLNWSMDAGLIKANPAARMKKPAKERPRKRALDDDEIMQVWPALELVGWPYGQILRLIMLTAQRPGEVARMRWADLDLDAATWHQHADATKTEEAILVPLSSMAMDIIRPLPRLPGQFVFPGRGGDKPASNIDRGRDRAQKIAGIAHWTPHDLRRTAATQLGKLGATDELVDRILNHALPRVRGTYNVHGYLNEKREALELLSEHVKRVTAR